MEERVALFREYETGFFSATELCRRHGISRETFYVWRERRAGGDARWFEDRSHAAKHCPHATSAALVERIEAAARHQPQAARAQRRQGLLYARLGFVAKGQQPQHPPAFALALRQ